MEVEALQMVCGAVVVMMIKINKSLADGERYEGDWKSDRMDGHGVYMFVDGSVYEGQWMFGRMNGDGLFKSRFGDKYEGSWRQGRMDGVGR